MIADRLSVSVIEMKRVLSYDEYTGWYAYLSKKPPEINEIQMATLMSMIGNMFGGKTKPIDFMISPSVRKNGNGLKSTAFDSFNAVATDFDSRKK